MTNLLRIGRLGDAPTALQHVNVEETQGRQAQDYGVRAELQLGEEHRLILANVFRAKLIGRAPEVPAEVRHTVQVCADGCIGEVAALQLLKHELTQLVHRESSFSVKQATPAASKVGSATRGCVRRRSGFVQVGFSTVFLYLRVLSGRPALGSYHSVIFPTGLAPMG